MNVIDLSVRRAMNSNSLVESVISVEFVDVAFSMHFGPIGPKLGVVRSVDSGNVIL